MDAEEVLPEGLEGDIDGADMQETCNVGGGVVCMRRHGARHAVEDEPIQGRVVGGYGGIDLVGEGRAVPFFWRSRGHGYRWDQVSDRWFGMKPRIGMRKAERMSRAFMRIWW